ncbi:MAG: hypothetical protein KAG18_03060, partial [Sinobacterium sp.]|nr:hypothetical protein [Sinobacterium sp.]
MRLFDQHMKITLPSIVMLIGLSAVSMAQASKPVPEQTLYFGGDIITMQGDKPEYVEAVIERNGKIIYVGDK